MGSNHRPLSQMPGYFMPFHLVSLRARNTDKSANLITPRFDPMRRDWHRTIIGGQIATAMDAKKGDVIDLHDKRRAG
jgi:hypothetical protein